MTSSVTTEPEAQAGTETAHRYARLAAALSGGAAAVIVLDDVDGDSIELATAVSGDHGLDPATRDALLERARRPAPGSDIAPDLIRVVEAGSHAGECAARIAVLEPPGEDDPGLHAHLRDLADGLAAELDTHADRSWHSSLLDHAPTVLARVDREFRHVYVNRAMEQALGRPREEIIGRSIHELGAPPEIVAIWEEALPRVIESGREQQIQFPLMGPDGERYFHCRLAPERGPDGTVEHVLCSGHDVTRLERTERALRESERQYRMVVENSGDIIFHLDPGGAIRYISPSVERILGYESHELTGRNMWDLVHADDIDVVGAAQEATRVESGSPVTVRARIRHRDGGWRVLEGVATYRVDEEGNGSVIGIARDVTDRLEMEEALRHSEARYRNLVENSRDAIYMSTLDGRIVELNPAGIELFGLARDGLAELHVADLYENPVDRQRFKAAMKENDGVRDFELPLRRVDTGEVVDCLITSSYRRDQDGEVIGYQGIIRDVTERKRAESALREAKETLEAVIDASPLAISIVDRHGDVMLWNRAAEEIFGWSADEIIGGPPPGGEEAERNIARFMDDEMSLMGHEIRRVHKDGSPLLLKIWAAALRDEAGQPRGGVALMADVTEQKALEEELRESRKLEAIGRLAGGVAHGFNNLLTAIQGNTALLLENDELDGEARQSAAEIGDSAERAAALTRQLLAFSRRQILQPRTLDLNDVIRDMTSMLQQMLGAQIRLSTELAEDGALTKADRAQIEQILMNLALNADDALPDGGALHIATYQDRYPDPEDIPGHDSPFTVLAVTDDGTGIEPEIQDRIFEPFFTTKPTGKGAGLGLSTVYGIVKQSGGHVGVDSAPGAGTTIKIFLPADRGRPDGDEDARTRDETPEPATVLVVEDESAVRSLIRRVLEKHGYTVLEATNGKEALAVWDGRGEEIDVVVTDVVMPEMSGPELVTKLRALRPELRVLFISGYSEEAIASEGKLHAGAALLEKPFTPDTLLAHLRDALDRTKPNQP